MKKILALVLVLSLLLSLGACTKRPESSEIPAEPDKTAETLPNESESENVPAETPEASEPSPADKPEETPAETPETSEPTPSAQPEETPEPGEEPEESPEPSEEPKEETKEEPKEENVNDSKVDTSATVSSTATDLAPADSSFLALIPELPFEGWASTTIDENSIMLELKNLPSDVQSKLMEYIQTLRDEDFDVTEYIYGSLYEASKDGVTLSIMLEGGKLTLTIDKK